MKEKLYSPQIAAKVTLVSEDMQRSLRSRFAQDWENAIGVEVNGRWLFTESDLIALASHHMHTEGGSGPKQASDYASLLRRALHEDPNAEAATISVGWPGDRKVVSGATPFDPGSKARYAPLHFNMIVNVSSLRRFVRDGLASIESKAD